MRTVHRRELIFQNAHRARARAQICRPKMVLMTSQVSKMSTALGESTILNTNVHRAQARGPRRVPGAPVGGAIGKKYWFLLFETYVRRIAPPRESHEPSRVNSTRIAPARGVARRATAGGLISAARGRAQRNEFNLRLDLAGHRFGATAQGGMRQRSLCMVEKCGNVARK